MHEEGVEAKLAEYGATVKSTAPFGISALLSNSFHRLVFYFSYAEYLLKEN